MKSRRVNRLTLLAGLVALTTTVSARAESPEADGAAEKIRTVSKGERVQLTSHLAKGKYTIFEFFDDNWTSEGLEVSAQIEGQVRASADMVLRRVEIPSWNAPAVYQHALTALPHYKFFDPSGQLVKEFSPESASRPPAADDKDPHAPTTPGLGISPPPAPKVQTISKGERVELAKHLARGRYTVVEFYADW